MNPKPRHLEKPDQLTPVEEHNLIKRIKSNPWLWLGAMILLTAFMWCYRRPDALTHPQFWAEDGAIFFIDAYHHGFSSLWMDHGGYYHLVPRVVALLGLSLIPLVFQPLFYNLFCLFGILAIIAYLWFRLSFSPGKKFFMALSLTCAPIANEVMLSLAGFHFILSLCPIILLLGGLPKNGLVWCVDLFVMAISGLSGPFLTLFSPLLLLAALIVLSVTILLYGSAIIFLNPYSGGPRYFYIPAVMILWTAILGWPQKHLRFLAVLFVNFFVFYSIAYTSKPWVDYQWPDYASRITTEKEFMIPINPSGVFIKIQDGQASCGKVGETNSNRQHRINPGRRPLGQL